MKVPCHDCTVETWGACHHQEYGKCMYVDFKVANMNRTYSKRELQDLDAFELWGLAEQLQVKNFEHLSQFDLIEGVLEKQNEITINQ